MLLLCSTAVALNQHHLPQPLQCSAFMLTKPKLQLMMKLVFCSCVHISVSPLYWGGGGGRGEPDRNQSHNFREKQRCWVLLHRSSWPQNIPSQLVFWTPCSSEDSFSGVFYDGCWFGLTVEDFTVFIDKANTSIGLRPTRPSTPETHSNRYQGCVGSTNLMLLSDAVTA